jgi:hypothetical protein
MRSRFFAPGAGLAIALLCTRASAGGADDRARARDAYDRGAAAHARGDHATEARELALADAILPNAVTLQAAIEAAIEADDAVLAITLCDRARRGPVEGPLGATVQRAAARFSQRVGRLHVGCIPASPCTVTIDGIAADAGRDVVLRVGTHAVVVQSLGSPDVTTVDVTAGRTQELMLTAIMDPAEPSPSHGRPLGWFIAALGATVVAGGVTVGLAVDTASKHGAFVSAGCPGPVHGDCAALASDGTAAQLRTNVLLGVTAALAVTTVVAGVLTFRSRGAERAALSIGAGPVAVLRVPLP